MLDATAVSNAEHIAAFGITDANGGEQVIAGDGFMLHRFLVNYPIANEQSRLSKSSGVVTREVTIACDRPGSSVASSACSMRRR